MGVAALALSYTVYKSLSSNGKEEVKADAGTKVVVVGGGGQAGKIHVTNLKKFGATVGNCDFFENKDCDDNFIGKIPYSVPFSKGYKVAIVALPDRMCFQHCKDMIEAGFERILVEKPGCKNVEELQELVKIAESKGVTFYINYQRTFDP